MNARRKVVELRIGNPVCYRIRLKKGKLDQRWEPYYRIVEKTSPKTGIRQTRKIHANDLKMAEVANWEISEPKTKKARTRKATLLELEKIETDGDSGEEKDRDIGRQPVKADHCGPDKAVRVP